MNKLKNVSLGNNNGILHIFKERDKYEVFRKITRIILSITQF